MNIAINRLIILTPPTFRLRVLLRNGLRSLLFCLAVHQASAQCTLICNQALQISLDGTGQFTLTPEIIAPTAATFCPGQLQLRIFNEQGFLINGTTLNCDLANQTLIAQLKHTQTGNTCLSSITVKDQQPPSAHCQPRFLSCYQDRSPETIGRPLMADNCTPAASLQISYSDSYTNLLCGVYQAGQSVTERIDRHWTVRDQQGNVNACTEELWIKRPSVDSVVFPKDRNDIQAPALLCGQDPKDLTLTGRPTIDGLTIGAGACDLAVIYSDQKVSGCGGSYAILRTWTVIDDCVGGLKQHMQTIRVFDKKAPALTVPADMTIYASSLDCTGNITLPQATASDECSAVTITPSWEFGSGYGPFTNIPLGTYTVKYTAIDACGNQQTGFMKLVVADQTPPQIICPGPLQVSLAANGTAAVSVSSVNVTAWDGCGNISLDVTRDNVQYGQSVLFDCSDIGKPATLTVRVTDEAGLENSCNVSVTARDFQKPSLQCPPDTLITCLDDYTNLQRTGEAVASDNCLLQSFQHTDALSLNACRTGFVYRLWTATDASGNARACGQRITIAPVSITGVNFPPDISINQCATESDLHPNATGRPSVNGLYCSAPGIAFSDQVFSAPGACMRILRHWKVSDDCGANGPQVWEKTQLITVSDQAPPALKIPADITVGTGVACNAVITMPDASATDCSEATIQHNSIFADAPGANISGRYPPGVHIITFTATDACGNATQQTMRITVKDLTPPTARCKTGQSVYLGSDGRAQLNASQFDNGSTDNCTIAGQLNASVSPTEFACEHLGVRSVTLTMRDEAGNESVCQTNVIIADSAGVCKPPVFYNVEGWIKSPNGTGINGIPIDNGRKTISDSGLDGRYQFDDLPAGYDYVLRPQNNHKWGNGITTFDLVMISKHILATEPFDSPFKVIAADANGSGTITAFDIVQLRKLILGLSDSVQGNTSWRFIPAGFVFPDPGNPFGISLPNSIALPSLAADRSEQNFVAVKIGDVNMSADAVNPRSPTDTGYVYISDRFLNAGETAEVAISLSAWSEWEGLQFELKADDNQIAMESIVFPDRGLCSASHTALRDSLLAVSWDNIAGAPSDADTVLFTVKVRAKKACYTANAFQIEPRRIASEAYRAVDGEQIALALARRSQAAPEALGQAGMNYPNPFASHTRIPYYLPKAQKSALYVSDALGRTVWVQEREAVEGANEWLLSRDKLPEAGIYFFQIRAESGPVASGKMRAE